MRVAFILNKYGDLGNRLFRFARLYHKASKLGVTLIDISFYQYVWYFEPENKFYRCVFFLQKIFGFQVLSIFQKISTWTILNSCISKIQIPSHANVDEVENILAKQTTFFSLLECSEILPVGIKLDEDARLQLEKIFTINPRYIKSAKEILGLDRDLYTCIGVHIRHGDYREYCEGMFFLETQKYIEAMKELAKTYKGQKKLRFAIVCNEKLDPDLFEGLDVVFGLSDNPIVDMSILQNCNYIISTISSFSAWPSLVAKIPRIVINADSVTSWDKMHTSSINYWEQ
jgi:hypothetical protein